MLVDNGEEKYSGLIYCDCEGCKKRIDIGPEPKSVPDIIQLLLKKGWFNCGYNDPEGETDVYFFHNGNCASRFEEELMKEKKK